MIPVMQADDTGWNGTAGVGGDCVRACVSSVLELPFAEVPHFMADPDTARVWPLALRDWLARRGLEIDTLAPAGDFDDVLRYMGRFHAGDHYILAGRSGDDFGHVVVGLGGSVVHDPSPRVPRGSHALTGPLPNGRYLAMLIRPTRTPILPAPIDFSPVERHERIGLLFSGGKDSLALWHLFRPCLDRLTVYHVDTGDLMPETADIAREIEARTPHFIRINSDVRGWIAANGLPSDLVPGQCTPAGRFMLHGEAGVPVVSKWDCCAASIWQPKAQRLAADGITLTIQGTRRTEPGWGFVDALHAVARPRDQYRSAEKLINSF
jgi:hypothetical protein